MKGTAFLCVGLLMTVTVSAQNVGINTDGSAPGMMLDVKVASGNDGIRINNNSGTGDAMINLQDAGTSAWSFGMDASNANRLVFDNGGALSTTNVMVLETGGDVGIGINNPTEALHVNGNVRLSGALMPNNLPGTANQPLLSGGAGAPPTWGPQMWNTGAMNGIGKYYTGTFNINNNTYLTLDIADANMVVGSVVAWTYVGNLAAAAGLFWGYVVEIEAEARAGVVRFHITNTSGYNLTNIQLGYVAYY